jgi:hypothetical protein
MELIVKYKSWEYFKLKVMTEVELNYVDEIKKFAPEKLCQLKMRV